MELVSIEDFARIKGKSVKTIYNWINKGLIKVTKIGKHRLINKNEQLRIH